VFTMNPLWWSAITSIQQDFRRLGFTDEYFGVEFLWGFLNAGTFVSAASKSDMRPEEASSFAAAYGPMERRYYLSKFIGDGKTRETSFKPKVSEYDKGWGIIDLRSDPTQRVGWCFTYLDSNDHVRVETDPDIIVIGKDAHTILPGEVKPSCGRPGRKTAHPYANGQKL